MIAQLRLKYARSLELISSLEAEHSDVQGSLERELSTQTSLVGTLTEEVTELKDQLSKSLTELLKCTKVSDEQRITIETMEEKIKQMGQAFLESESLHEKTRSSQLDIDAELLDLRKRMVAYENELKQIRHENESLKQEVESSSKNQLSDAEIESWKLIESKLKSDLEQTNIDLENALRQLTVEKNARKEAERIRNETGEQLALCASKLRNLTASKQSLEEKHDVAQLKIKELTSSLVSERATAFENESFLSNRITELESELAQVGGNKFKKFVALKQEKKELQDELSTLKGTVNIDKLCNHGNVSLGATNVSSSSTSNMQGKSRRSSSNHLQDTRLVKTNHSEGGNSSWPPIAPNTTANSLTSLTSGMNSNSLSHQPLLQKSGERSSRQLKANHKRVNSGGGEKGGGEQVTQKPIEMETLQWRHQHQLQERSLAKHGQNQSNVNRVMTEKGERIRAAF